MIFVKGKLVVCYTVLFILPRDKWSFCFKHVFPILEFKNYGFEYIKNARIVSIVHTKKYIFNTIILLQKKTIFLVTQFCLRRCLGAISGQFGIVNDLKSSILKVHLNSPIMTVNFWDFVLSFLTFQFWLFHSKYFSSNFGRPIWTVQFWSLKHHPPTHFKIFAAAIFLLQHSGTNYSTCSRPFLWQKSIQIQLERFGTKLTIFHNAMSCWYIS